MKKTIRKSLAFFALTTLFIQQIPFGELTILFPKAYAASTASCGLDIAPNISSNVGESFTYEIELSNNGTSPGYAPYVETVLPEGTAYASAEFSLGNLPLSPIGGTPILVVDNDAGDPATGSVSNPLTGELTLFPVGSQYVVFDLPIGSYVPGQTPVQIRITGELSGALGIGAPLSQQVQARCGFALGNDPLDNMSTDPVVQSAFIAATVTPTVLQATKSYSTSHGEGETATGPDFPITYAIGANIANTAGLTAISITETIPDGLQILDFPSLINAGPSFTLTFTPSTGAPQSTTSLPWAPSGGFGTGGSLTLTVPSATGSLAADDIQLMYRGYIPDKYANGADIVSHSSGSSVQIDNTVSVSGMYGSTPVSDSLLNPVTLTARSLATQKSVNLINDIGGEGYSQGDTVRYTINFQVSDYFSFEKVVIEDLMGDGLTYIDGSARLSVTEDGVSNNNLSFNEADVPEGSVITATSPPAHDFSTCAGCTLAITEDTVNDDDAVSRPADGQTLLTFDISSTIAAVGGEDNRLVGGVVQNGTAGTPTIGTITFEALVDDNFVDTQANDLSIDSNDTIENDARISGALYEGALTNTFSTDSTGADFAVPPPTFMKELIGLKPYGGVIDVEPFADAPPLQIASGDEVTYRFTIRIPSGNLERLEITDYLPIPFFDANEINTTFDTTVYTPADGVGASVPMPGRIAYGSNTAGVTPLPTPTITKNAGTNTFTVAYNDMSVFEKTPSAPTTLELFFTVTAQPKPMADQLKIVNMTTFGTDASNANAVVSSSSVAQNITKFPQLRIHKGAVGTDKAGAIFTPAVVGPVTFDGPAAPVPFVGGSFSTADLIANPIDSNVSGLDAGDRVTFAVVVENYGSANAYDLRVDNTLPAGFDAPTSIADLNMRVYDANGTDRSGDTIGGLFGFTATGGNTDSAGDTRLRLDTGQALPGHTGDALTTDGLANEGANILVITFDLEVADAVTPRQVLTSLAKLTQYSSLPGGDNFVDENDGPQNDASVTIADIMLQKTNEDAPVGNMTYTATGSATEGEILRFRVKVTLPEGTAPATTVTDNIPNGLRYFKTNGVTVDTTAACTPVSFNGTLPTVSVTAPTGATGLGTNGQDLVIALGSALTASDNDTTNNSFCLLYDVAVDTTISAPVSLTNSVTLAEGTNIYGPATSVVTGVEPILSVSKTATPTSGDAGNYITYSITVAHTAASSADAVELTLSDLISPKLLVDLADPVTTFDTDGLDNDADGLVDAADPDEVAGTFYNSGTKTFTWNFGNTNNAKYTKLDVGQTMTMRFKAKILSSVTPTEVVGNTASVSYGSIAGVADSGIEKAGTANGSRNITITNVSSSKATNSTSEATTGTARVNGSNPDLTPGEVVTFRITLHVPESSLSNLVVNDPMPAGLRVDSAVVVSDGTGSPAPTITIDDTVTVDGINDRARFVFGSILPPGAPGSSTQTRQIILDVTATVLDSGVNTNGQTKVNTVTTTWTGQVGGAQTASTSIDIVEPVLALDKSFSSTSGDAGDTTVMTLSLQHGSTSNADAFDLSLVDTMPAGMEIDTDFGNDGIDNDNDGIADGADAADEATLATNSATATTLTLNTTTTGNPLMTQLPRATPGPVVYRVRVNILPSVFPNQFITNTAALNWTTLSGVVADERTKNTSDNAVYTVNNASITKAVINTSLTETGTSQLNGALTDLTIGETVTYRINVPFPEGMATNVRIRDTLPSELQAVSGTLVNADGITHQFAAASLLDLSGGDGVNDTIDFTLGNVTNTPDSDTETVVVEVVARVRNHTSVSAATNRINTATFTFDEQLGGPLAATAGVDIVEPGISITKGASTVSGDAGDEITYTIVVTNTGSAPIYDLVVTDTPPADITVATGFATDGVDNDGDGSRDEGDEATLTLAQGTDLIWSEVTGVTAFAAVLPGASYTLRYTATIAVEARPNTTHVNTVTGEGTSIPGGGAASRSVSDSDDVTVTITDSSSIVKTLRNAVVKKQIGDKVPYRITVAMQEGTTQGFSVQDTLPTGMLLDPASISILSSAPATLTWTGTPAAAAIVPASAIHTATTPQILTFDFGTVTNADTNNLATESITIEYDAIVANVSGNSHGTLHQNTAATYYETTLEKGPVVAPVIMVVEPALNVDLQNSYASGDTVVYQAFIENNGADVAGILHDVRVRITLPTDILFDETFTPVISGPPGALVNTSVAGIVDLTFPQLDTTWNNGNPASITFRAAIDTALAPGGIKTASASYTGSSQPGIPGLLISGQNLSSERTGNTTNPGGAANDLLSMDLSSMTVTRPYLETSYKELIDVNGGDLRIGDVVTYRIHLENTGNLDASAITVVDDLPEFMAPFTVTALPAGASSLLDPAPAGLYGEGQLTVSAIAVAQGGSALIEYTAHVQTLTPDQSDATNRAIISAAAEGGEGKELIVTETILAPILTLTKTATVEDNASVVAGSSLSYIVTVENTGSAPATNLVMTDLFPPEFTYTASSITEDTVSVTDVADGDNVDVNETTPGTLTAVVPSLAAGGSITWEWDGVTVAPVNPITFTNTAAFTSAEGYTGDDSHTVNVRSKIISGPGGGFSPTVSPTVTPPPENKETPEVPEEEFVPEDIPEPDMTAIDVEECVDMTPVVAVNAAYCLELDPQRPVTFTDVPEEHPLWPYIMTLKNTRIVETGDYIASGTGNHSTGKQQAKFQEGAWPYQPDRSMTRLEVVKVAMIANCLPIDENVLSETHGLVFKDLGLDVAPADEAMHFAARTFYSALKYGVITGDKDGMARPLDPVTPQEAIAIMLRAAQATNMSFNSAGDWSAPYTRFALDYRLLTTQELQESGTTLDRGLMAKVLINSMGFNPDPAVHGYIERIDLEKQAFQDTMEIISAKSLQLAAMQSSGEENMCVQKFESCLIHEPDRELEFVDAKPASWAYPYIDMLRTTKIIKEGDYVASGNGNQSTGRQQEKFASGTWNFEPERFATRLEFLKVVLVTNCISIEDTIPIPPNGFSFVDLPMTTSPQDETKYFAARVMYTGHKYGLITGTAQSEARPFDLISRAEALAILQRARVDRQSVLSEIPVDLEDVAPEAWYRPMVGYFIETGIIGDLGVKLFHPHRPIKRSEMAKLIYDFMLLNPREDIRSYALHLVNIYDLEHTIQRIPAQYPRNIKQEYQNIYEEVQGTGTLLQVREAGSGEVLEEK